MRISSSGTFFIPVIMNAVGGFQIRVSERKVVARKYCILILVMFLCCGILMVQDATGKMKSSRASANRGKHSKIANKRPPQKLVLKSASALVEDQRTGELLVQKRVEQALPIASITKLMTAMVVLDAQMNLNESITIESADVDTLRHSRSRLRVGTLLTRKDALLLALMASENRAAHALGRTYPGGINAFVNAMNAKAQSLGLKETRFDDPSGLSNKNVASARDLARMVDAAYQYRLIREFSTCEGTSIISGHRTLRFCNSNRLVRNPHWQIGLSKTGFIDESGPCLVMQARIAYRPLLIVLLDSPGKLTRFADANRIKQWMEREKLARLNRGG